MIRMGKSYCPFWVNNELMSQIKLLLLWGLLPFILATFVTEQAKLFRSSPVTSSISFAIDNKCPSWTSEKERKRHSF